jgi:trehalose synthase
MAYGSRTHTLQTFQDHTKPYVGKLQGKTIWMINSTAVGGGVAEMLPSQIRLMREMGISIEWLVIEATDPDFFDLTKRIHNAIHGSGNGAFTREDLQTYEKVNRQNLDNALSRIQDGDLVVIHDPQPMPLAKLIREHRRVKILWRCHIGLEKQNQATRAAWSFLEPYYASYDRFVFSLPAYVPERLENQSAIITPAIDPLSHKNRILQVHKCIGILHQSGIINDKDPVLHPFYKQPVRRIMPDGSFKSVNFDSNLDLIYRPAATQISRWDRLKGFSELMEAFILMKRQNEKNDPSLLNTRRIQKTRLVLGGPDPQFVSDDPEGKSVLEELTRQYQSVDARLQEDIAILLLPLENPRENALIVNALQKSSSVVVQNSLQEGFGLTATEAMWKQKPVLVSGAAGLRHQVQDGINGRINPDPSDIPSLANTLESMLNDPMHRDQWGFNAQIRVIRNFALFAQIEKWLELLSEISEN